MLVASLAGAATAAEPAVRVIAAPADRAAVTAVAARVAVRTGGPGIVARRYVTGTPGEAFVLDARRSNGTLVAIDVHAVLASRVRYLGTSVADAASRTVYSVAPDGSRSAATAVEDAACSTNCNLASAVTGLAVGLGCGAAVAGGGLLGGAAGAFMGKIGCDLLGATAGYLVADNCETAEMCTPLIRWTQFTCGYPGCGGLGFIVSPYPITPAFTSVDFANSGNYIYTAAASFYFREANAVGYTSVTPYPPRRTRRRRTPTRSRTGCPAIRTTAPRTRSRWPAWSSAAGRRSGVDAGRRRLRRVGRALAPRVPLASARRLPEAEARTRDPCVRRGGQAVDPAGVGCHPGGDLRPARARSGAALQGQPDLQLRAG